MTTHHPSPSRRWFVLPALTAALLAGCVNLAPPYAQPEAPIPQAWPSGVATPVDTGVPADVGWRDFFIEERLRNTVALALDNNRDLRVAVLNIEQARARYGIARSSAFPSVDLAAGGTRSRTPGGLSSSDSPPRIASQYSVDLGLTSYELDLFGRVRNLGDSALQSYLATVETQRSVHISLVSEVASAWLTLAADQQRLQLARDTLASQQRSFALIQHSHALGAQSGLALARAQSTVQAAMVDAAAYDSQVEQDGNALALLVGAPLPAGLLPLLTASDSPTPASRLLALPAAGLPSSVLQQRPDVLASEYALRASHADIGAARAAFYPRIALTGSIGSASTSLSGLFESGSAAWSFMPSISLPIFNGGLNRANLQVAEVQQKIQLAGYEKTLQTAFREVADALAARRTLDDRLTAHQALLVATARSVALSQALFTSGGIGYLDVLDAQRSLYAVQQSLIGLQFIEQTNRLALYKALGGGFAS